MSTLRRTGVPPVYFSDTATPYLYIMGHMAIHPHFLYEILFLNVGVEFIRPEFCGLDKSSPYFYRLNAIRSTLYAILYYILFLFSCYS